MPNENTGDAMVVPDASVDAAVPIDGPVPVALKLFAASHQMLYQVDVDTKTASLVGTIQPGGGSPVDVDGLALYGANLLGISDGGGSLITIDVDDAAVTNAIPLTPAGTWGGLTVVPAGDLEAQPVVLAGTPADGKLYRIDPATGTVTMVGPFTGGYRFFTDLAWVHGAGLYATITGGDCMDVCFAKIDPATGTATPFRTNLGTNIYGMSGYRDRLWAFNSGGAVLSVNRTNGLMTVEVDSAIAWTEAAQ